jgi:hypothetical protein
MIRRLLCCAPVVALVVLATAAPEAAAQKFTHPRLRHALHELIEARKEVTTANHNFGGHRDKAVRAIDDAIGDIRAILAVKGDAIPGVDRKAAFYTRHKDHPHLRQCLEDLRDAREDLRNTKVDFGKRREDALRDVNIAIEQVELLIKNAR